MNAPRAYSLEDHVSIAVERETQNLRAQRDGAFRERDAVRLELGQRDALIRSLRTELQDLRRLVDMAGAGEPGAARW